MVDEWKTSLAVLGPGIALGALVAAIWNAANLANRPPGLLPPIVPYRIEWLDPPNGEMAESTANAVNASGAVVGQAELHGQTCAFLSFVDSQRRRVWVNLNDLAAAQGKLDLGQWRLWNARDINDRFEIAGQAQRASDQRFYPYRLRLATRGGKLQEDQSGRPAVDSIALLTDFGPGTATGINDRGHVTGQWYAEQNPARGFLWTSDGTVHHIGPVGRAASICPAAVNASDQITGYAAGPDGYRGVRYTPGASLQDLGGLPQSQGGFCESWGSDIHDSGAVVGKSSAGTRGGFSVYHAFLYTDQMGMVDLGTLGGSNSEATGVNSWFDVVGVADRADGTTAIFLLKVGQTAMAEVVICDGDIPARNAKPASVRINIARQICGTFVNRLGDYWQSRAFLLTPAE